MTTAHPSNKEQEIGSCSLSAILAALVDAVDRLALAVESGSHPLSRPPTQSPLAAHELTAEVAAFSPLPAQSLQGPGPLEPEVPLATQAAEVPSATQAADFVLVPPVGSAAPGTFVSESNATPFAGPATGPAPTPTGTTVPVSLAGVNANPAGPSSPPHIPTPDEVRARYMEMPSTASRTWFVVTRGRLPGLYATWMETSPLVIGVSCAVFNKYTTKEEALEAYGAAWASGNVTRL
ncbi:hypothetical protein F5887DRAFT_1082553 [Amanita rubescens]|nr:hypothetical protein F5887DRAFT_1082553 [Amanita rubescens]